MDIEVSGKIVNYLANDLISDYIDGTFESHDGVQIKISDPIQYKNKLITIYMNNQGKIDQKWTQLGKKVTFKITQDNLENSNLIFEGALIAIKFTPFK